VTTRWLSTDHINEKGRIIFTVSGSSSDEGFVPIEELEVQFQPSRPFPFGKRGFYASDSSDEEVIQEVSDEGIGGDEGVNMEEGIEEGILL
jgi:hypothetical protein